MEIYYPKKKTCSLPDFKEDIQFLNNLLINPSNICKGCEKSCPYVIFDNKGEYSCVKECDEAQYALSSDPDNHPIELGILPLVASLKATGVFIPCWSCEGHMSFNGRELSRSPSVWFSCSSMAYLRLLEEYIGSQYKSLSINWHIALVMQPSLREGTETLFSLQPNLSLVNNTPIKALHQDIEIIAKGLLGFLREETSDYLFNL